MAGPTKGYSSTYRRWVHLGTPQLHRVRLFPVTFTIYLICRSMFIKIPALKIVFYRFLPSYHQTLWWLSRLPPCYFIDYRCLFVLDFGFYFV